MLFDIFIIKRQPNKIPPTFVEKGLYSAELGGRNRVSTISREMEPNTDPAKLRLPSFRCRHHHSIRIDLRDAKMTAQVNQIQWSKIAGYLYYVHIAR